MAVNRVEVDGEVKLDLSADSVSPQTMLAGATAHDAAGEAIEGAVVVAPIDAAPTEGSPNAVSSGGVWSALQESGGGSSAVTGYTVTVPASGWTASGAFKKNTVTVAGLKDSYPQRPRIDCDVTNTDAESDAAMMAAFALLTGAETGTDSLTLYIAGKIVPDINLSVYLEVAE